MVRSKKASEAKTMGLSGSDGSLMTKLCWMRSMVVAKSRATRGSTLGPEGATNTLPDVEGGGREEEEGMEEDKEGAEEDEEGVEEDEEEEAEKEEDGPAGEAATTDETILLSSILLILLTLLLIATSVPETPTTSSLPWLCSYFCTAALTSLTMSAATLSRKRVSYLTINGTSSFGSWPTLASPACEKACLPSVLDVTSI
mmetsp:Transcript_6228/g.11992  ORF Transcript_6228/g.11992 Transcript_6228/m.11992 type:complete len:200 (+) Transcript_6228:1121-1720(+)